MPTGPGDRRVWARIGTSGAWRESSSAFVASAVQFRYVRRVRRLVRRRCVVEDDARDPQPPPLRRLDRQQGMVQGPQAPPRHDQERIVDPDGQVRDRRPLGDRAEKAADALDQGEIGPEVGVGDPFSRRCEHLAETPGPPRHDPGRDRRRQRLAEEERHDFGERPSPADRLNQPFRVVASPIAIDDAGPRRQRLERGHATARLGQQPADRGGNRRLADAGVGAGDEEAGDRHRRSSPAASSMQRPRMPSISVNWSAEIANGGMTIRTSPIGRMRRPKSRARAQIRPATRRARSNGSFVARSATSSIPPIRPQWRTSPTWGRSRIHPAAARNAIFGARPSSVSSSSKTRSEASATAAASGLPP